MSSSLEHLKGTLSHLPPAERAELAEYLLRSLESEQKDARAEWLALAEDWRALAENTEKTGMPGPNSSESAPESVSPNFAPRFP